MSLGPLAHLTVVDVTDIRAALAGRLLADLGADVIKIEPPGGDRDRWRPPFAGNVAAADRSLPFLYRHANKRGACIDVATADGRRRFDALCEDADILVENVGPDDRYRCGLKPEAVRARHPHLIHVVIADFGLSGPRAAWRLEPLPAFAAAGALHNCGFLDRPPCWLPGYLAHDCASVFGIVGALAALLDRPRCGGQTVEVSVQEAGLNGTTPWSITLADYARVYPMVAPSPPRNADGAYLVLPAADGHIRVLAGTTRQWNAFVELLGRPALLCEDGFSQPLFRILMSETIRQTAAEVTRQRLRAEWFADARRLGVPLAPVHTPEEFVAHPHTQARGFFQRTGFPHLADAPFASPPFRFSATPVSVRRAAPVLDENVEPSPQPSSKGSGSGQSALSLGERGRVREVEGASGAIPSPPLAGIRVVHFGVVAVVPEMCWVLAELGAEVIKIESQTKLDPLREVTLEPGAVNRAFTFNDENRGARSVSLDLTTARGRELALQLCARADVVAENNRGGVMQGLGLGYEHVRQVSPSAIYLSSQGYGHTGPLSPVQSFGPLNSAFTGAVLLWNHPDAPYPAASTLNHPDHIVSKLGVVAVLAALEHRRRTGEGQFIDLAQIEGAAYVMGEVYLQSACTDRPPRPSGNEVDYAVPHGVYPCAGEDRWIAIAVVGDDAWERFTRCLDWPADSALATLDARRVAQADLNARVAEWTRTRSTEEAAELLQAAGISAMPLLSPDDLRADAHLAERGAIVTVQHPEIGPERHSGNPLRMSRSQLVSTGASPLLGADTEEVLTRVLGLSREEVAALVEGGVCR
jgi:crotonobetainyl-CoA:carnitine CoA-transferase CaiB-like acyl-CoA transferase